MSDFYGQALTQLANDFDWDPRTGYSIVQRWRGTPDSVAIKQAELFSLGVRHSVTNEDEGGYQIIRGYYGATETHDPAEPLSDDWSLVGNQLDKSIWTLPKVATELDKFGSSFINAALLRKYVEEYLRGETTTTDASGTEVDLDLTFIQSFATTNAPGFSTTVLDGLMKALARGVETKQISQFVLRRVLIIPENSTIVPFYDYVNEVLTTTELSTGTDPGAGTIPATIKFTLPPGVWVKQTPTVERAASNKWQITQEWWHADAVEPFIYDP